VYQIQKLEEALKRNLFAIVIAPCLLLAGCIHQPTGSPAPALPAGAADQVDAHANRVLQDIQAFVTPYARDIKSGKLKASGTQRAVLNRLDGFYNQAIVAEKQYHECMVVHTSVSGAVTVSTACLASSGLSGALASAEGSFTDAQGAMAGAIGQ
jgi:hypothetical protein